jgi:hypothetical protein
MSLPHQREESPQPPRHSQISNQKIRALSEEEQKKRAANKPRYKYLSK